MEGVLSVEPSLTIMMSREEVSGSARSELRQCGR